MRLIRSLLERWAGVDAPADALSEIGELLDAGEIAGAQARARDLLDAAPERA